MQQQYLFQLTILLLTLFVASSAGSALPSSTNKRRVMIPRHHREHDDDAQKRAVSSSCHHHADAQSKEISFIPVVYVSIFNCVVNILRPDPAIIWQARIPRALWELCIAIVARSATALNPSICLLLCLMTVPTALMDIFVWAPSFALVAKFETCTGGGFFSKEPRVCTADYVKGVGRLVVSVQSLLTGVFYLFTAVVSWTVFIESRDTSIATKNARAMADIPTMGNIYNGLN